MRVVKDVADRLVALGALVLLSPVLIGLSIWILVTMGRPVFFVQERAGRDGVPFRMWKFRTMVNDAIGVGRRMGLTADPFGLVENDPRITRAGAFLRRTSLDELPQLFNVVLGQMSLVGPRPDVLPQGGPLLHRGPRAARRQAGDHRLGTGQRPRQPHLAGTVRAGPLVRAELDARAGPADPLAHRGDAQPGRTTGAGG